jgi:hypothetical protein
VSALREFEVFAGRVANHKRKMHNPQIAPNMRYVATISDSRLEGGGGLISEGKGNVMNAHMLGQIKAIPSTPAN